MFLIIGYVLFLTQSLIFFPFSSLMVMTKRQQSFHTPMNLQIQGPLRAQFTSPQSKAALNPGSHGHTSSTAVNHCSIQVLHNYYKLNFLLRSEGVSGLQQSPATNSQKKWGFFFQVQFQFSRKETKESLTLPLFWPTALQRVCKKWLHGKWNGFGEPALDQHRDHTA